MTSRSRQSKAQQKAFTASLNSCSTCLQPRKPVGDGSPSYGQHKQDRNALASNGQQIPAGTMTRFGRSMSMTVLVYLLPLVAFAITQASLGTVASLLRHWGQLVLRAWL